MKLSKLPLGLVFVLLIMGILPMQTLAQSFVKRQAYCERGGQRVNTNGASSTTAVQQSLPSCTITVYLTGTTTLASLYSDSGGVTPLSNPITADTTGYYSYYTAPGRYDERFSGGTAPNNIASPFTKTDIVIGAGTVFQNLGVDLPLRPKVNLVWPFLLGTDNATSAVTELRPNRTPTGVYNAVTDLNISADPRLYETTVNIPVGATSVTLTGVTKETRNGIPDTATNSVYPLRYYANSLNTWKVGQGIRIPDGVSSGVDLIATITAVSGQTLTFTPATTNANSIDFIQHDDTAAVRGFFSTYTAGTLQIPDGWIPVSSFYNYDSNHPYAISIPATSEALNHQWIIEGSAEYRSAFVMTGPGHAIKLGGTTTNNLIMRNMGVFHANRYQLQTLDNESAGAGVYLASDQYNTEGVPQSGATNVKVNDVRVIGFKYGVFSDNLQSSKLTNFSCYYCNNGISLPATSNVRGLGSQTEPNANTIENTFFQYAPVLASNASRTVTVTTEGAHNTSGVQIQNASNIVTITSGSVFSTDLYRQVHITGASVNQTEQTALITRIIDSTHVELSQPPWIATTGLTMTLLPRSYSLIFLNNANNTTITQGTWQGNWTNSTTGDEVYGLNVKDSDQITYSSVWQEGNGGSGGAAFYAKNVRGINFLNSNVAANGTPGGYTFGVRLNNVIGFRMRESYIGTAGDAAADIFLENGTRGVDVDNSTLTSPQSILYGNMVDSTPDFYPPKIGLGMRYLDSTSGVASDAQMLYSTIYARNSLLNGNLAQGGTSWTLTAPGALTFVNAGTARGLRYVQVAPTTGGTNQYSEQMSQTISIPDSIPENQTVTLGFDFYIESRGADAISSAPTYNELRIKAIPSVGSTVSLSYNPSLSNGKLITRWERGSLTTRIGAGTGRTLKVQIECGQGANAAVFRLGNFRLLYGTHATFDDDEPITEVLGGTFQTTAAVTFLAGAGGGTQTVCVNNAGLVTFGVCGGGGGGAGTVTSVGYSLGTTGSDLNFSGTASPITTSGAFVLNVPNAGVGVRGVIPGSGSQTIGATWTLTSLLTTTGLQPAVDNVSMVGDTNLRYTAGHFGAMGVISHGDATNTKKLTTSNNGTKSFLTSDSSSVLDILVGSNGISLDTSGVGTAVGTGGFNTSALVTGQVAIARGGTNATSASYSTNGAFYYDGTKFITTATGGAGTLCLISTNGAAPTFGACSGSTATALSSITAASTTNTINSGDNSQIWKWTLTTSGATGFRISENTASAAAGTPHLIGIDTLSTSTVNPLQVTAQGTANGIRVDTDGLLAKIGTGQVRASQAYIENIGTGAFYTRYLVNETLSANRDLLIKVNDGNKTLDLGGNVTFGGAFTTTPSNALTFTTTGSTNVTLPTSGTLIGGSSLANTQIVVANSASTVTSSSAFTWSGSTLAAAASTAGPLGASFTNSSTNSAATTEVDLFNSANQVRVGITSTAFSGAPYSANQFFIESTGLTNGFVFNADSGARFSYLFAGTENSRLTSTGLCLGCTSPDGRLKITAASGDEAIKIGGYAPTSGSNVSAIDLTGTWNDGATAFVAPISVNMTDTASDAATNLLTVKVGGVDVLNMRKGGTITTGHTFAGTNTFTGANTFNTSTNVFSSRAEFSSFYLDAPGLFNLRIVPGASLTADRTLTITTPIGSNATWNVQGNLGLGGDLNSSAAVTLGTHALTFVTSGTTTATLPSGTSTLLSADSTNTVTNKTIDAGSNVILLPSKANFIAGGCNVSTAGAGFDIPSTGGATAVCIGTTNTSGLLQFADGATNTATAHFRLPSDWTSTGGVDFNIIYTGDTSSTNNIRLQASCGCVADGDDLIAPSYNAASANSFAGPATAGLRKTATLSGMTVTNCAAGETFYIKLERLGSDGADTYAGNARVLELEVTYWRSM